MFMNENDWKLNLNEWPWMNYLKTDSMLPIWGLKCVSTKLIDSPTDTAALIRPAD